MSDKPETEVKYSSYTEAQKNATKKYRANNKEKVNEQRKLYYKARKEKDPNFLEYKRQKAKEYYNKKKEDKPEELIVDPMPIPVLIRSDNIEEDKTPSLSTSESDPELQSVPPQKPTLKRSKKKVKSNVVESLEIVFDELKIEDIPKVAVEIDEGLKALEEWRPTMIMIGSPNEPEITPEPVKKVKKSKKDKSKDT